ncbi:MAG: Ig-like domain-containing protein [Lysobacteraceae bacterium]
MRNGLIGKVAGVMCLLLAGASNAATYSVYIDSDNDVSTGCAVTTAAGNAAGMDWRLTANSPDEPPAVSGLTLADCVGGSFGAGTAVGGAYPIGFDRVGGTTDIVELAFARELITGDVATDWNLFFVAESSLLGAVDVAGPVLVPALGRPLLPDPVPQPAVIPGTTTWGLGLLAIAVGLLTVWIARRHPGMLLWVVVIGGSSMLGIAWAANYLLDGEIADWDVPAVLSDASGDPTADEPQVDLLAGFAVRAGNQIFFRMDVRETRLPVILQPRLVAALGTPENTATGTVVGSLRNSTSGLAGLLTFSLQSQAPSNGFAVASNGDVSVADSAQLDFETRPSFTLQTQVGLTGVPALSIAHPVTITLSDVNEAPTVNDQAFSVFENDPNGTVLGGVVASDPDAGTAGQLSYAVTGGSGQAAFAVNASTGQVSISNASAFNLGGSPYLLNLTVSDGGVPSLTDTAVLTINVQDVNDAPSFTAGPAVAVNEDSGAYSASWATAIDDGDPGNQTLTFEISGNSNPALFQIAPALAANGTLSFTPAANANGSATMSVVLRDNGGTANGGVDVSAAQTLSITVNPQNDAPVVDLNGPAAGDGFNASFTEGAGSVAIVDAAALAITDIDSTQIQRADAVFAAVPDGASESLAADTSGTSLVATYTAGTGTLSIVGNATLADYQTVLRRLRYDNVSTNPTTSARNVVINAVDLEGAMSAPVTSVVSVAAVNTPPSFTAGGNVTVLEDAAAVNQAWASGISDGDGGGQTLNFEIVSNSNPALFSAGPAINASTGNLSFTPASNANGSATVVVQLRDNGGGSDVSPSANFDITLTAVNDAPSANVPANAPVALENSGAQTAVGFVTAIVAGPADEAGQTLTPSTVVQSTTGTLSFAVAPSINAASGTLTYTPAVDTSGTALVRFTLQDNGGVANGGVDTSINYDFTITVSGVNSAPVFTPGAATVTVNEDSAAYSAAWASAIDDGDADEVQSLTFVVLSNSNPSLFSSAPAIASNGQLSFTPTANANGTATLSIALRDNGGVANGGDDESDPVALQITVQSVNDAPSFAIPATAPVILENAGAQTVTGFATAMSAGPADESAQTLDFVETIDATTGSLTFVSAPSIDPLSGTLTYTATDNTSGTATISVVLNDNGGTANGGTDASAAQVFTIEVQFVNDPPTFVSGGNVSVNEDDAPYNAAWASAIDDGDAGVTQGLSFIIQSNDNPGLFATAPAISGATGNLSFTLAANANGIANLTVVLQDDGTGANTSGPVNFSITVNAVNDPPVVVPPTNVFIIRHIGRSLAAASPEGLLAIVSDPADGAGAASFTVTPQTALATTNGGRVTIASDGAWSYEPPAGSVASDSFDFEVCDSGVPAPPACTIATATLALSGTIVWFVDDSTAAGGDGTLARPFQTIADAVSTGGFNARIFVASGNYTAGATLLAGQQLIGQGVSVVSAIDFDTLFGIIPPAGSATRPAIGGTRPVIAAAAGNTVTLGIENAVRGIEIGSTSGVALIGSNFGTLTLGDNVINGSGQALNLNTGTLAQASAANAFDSITSTGGSNNIVLSAVGGTVNFGAGALSGATGTSFQFSNGTATINYAGSISKSSAGRLIDIDGAGNATVTLSGDLSCSASCGSGAGNQGIRVNARTGGTYTFSGASKTFTGTSTNPALQFTSNTGASIAFTGTTNLGTVANPLAGTAINATGGGSLSLNDQLNITTAGGRAMVVSDMTLAGTTTGAISTNGALGAGITVIDIQSSASSGTFQLGSTLNLDHNDAGETGGGINLVNNTGTWSFPNVTLSSTTGVSALRASNAGTLTMGQTTPGQLAVNGVPVLDVQNTTIGAAGLNFVRIDGGIGSVGILLNNTGASGGLSVTGSGSTAGSGGTISNGTTGISLTNTRNVSLSNMQLNDFSDYAIRGSGVVGFSLTGSTINGNNGNDAGADEGSVRFTELTGTATITNCNISGAVEHNMQVVNTSGLLNRLTVTGTTFGSMNATTGSDGLLIETQGTAVINATVSNNIFTYAIGDHFQFSVNSSTTNDVIFSNNTLSNSGVAAVSGGGGVRLIGGSNVPQIDANLSYDVLNNTIRDSRGTAIAVNKLGGNGVFAGVIEGNTVGVAGISNSGSLEGSAYFQIHDNAGQHNTTVRNNLAYQYSNYGIYLQAGGSGTVGNGSFHSTVTGNTVRTGNGRISQERRSNECRSHDG